MDVSFGSIYVAGGVNFHPIFLTSIIEEPVPEPGEVLVTRNARRITATGTVALNGETGTLVAYLDPQPDGSGAILGPYNVTLIGEDWTFQHDLTAGTWKLRLVLTLGNETTTFVSDAFKVLGLSGNIALPVPPPASAGS